jgi:ABC-type antimicrobial peptide transport system permease subunit
MWAVGFGLLVGVGGSLAVGQMLRNQLFQVSPSDPYSLIPALLLLALSALGTCLIPAVRAAMVDPIVVLRDE